MIMRTTLGTTVGTTLVAATLLASPVLAVGPIGATSALTAKILFFPTATGVGVTVGTAVATAVSGAANENRKALAVVAIEDAANYYASGELKGVLPSVLKRLRATSPELAKHSDAQLIDSLVEAAEGVLDGSLAPISSQAR